MATPIWFDSNAYFNNKLVHFGSGDSLSLRTAFTNAGYENTPEGMYKHFVEYGNAEGVSPNALFNTQQYLYNKAVNFYGKADVTTDQVKSMEIAMDGAGMSPWDHFNKFWSEGYSQDGVANDNFHNPSVNFDVAKYMNDKLAKMQATNPSYTMDMLVKAFNDAGLSPVTHYDAFGKAEGLTPQSVPGSTGSTYQLTSGDDVLYGTAGNDYFNAKVGTLNDGDYIDGAAGNDTLYANLKPGSNDVIAPSITNVETILFRAQLNTGGDNTGGSNITKSYIDAGNISLKDGQNLTLGSDNSRNGLEIEDVRHKSNETTIRFSNTDPGNVDFSVYFDSQHLTSNDTTKSGTLNLKIIDGENAVAGKPFKENPYDSVKFTYNDKVVEVKFGKVNGDSTYDDFVKALQAAIDADPTLAGLTVTKGPEFNWVNKLGVTVTGNEVLISTADGTVASTGGQWIASGGVPADSNVSTSMKGDNQETCPLIQTNVELDNIGRIQWDDKSACLPDNAINGSQAGDLVIGSNAGRLGVERFDITVDQGSWLSTVSSTNDTLRMITVKNGQINGLNDNGNLFIGDHLEGNTAIELGNWMNAPRLLKTDGLTNVKHFDASAMEGNVNIGAKFDQFALDKYMKDVDGLKTMYADNAPSGDFTYLFGKGQDTLNMSVNAGIAADRDFKLDIKMGAGNDLVNYKFENLTGSRVLDQIALNNVSVDLGDGNDAMWFWGNGAVKVNDGTGNDKLYLGQNTDQNAVFVLGANSAAHTFVTFTGTDGAQPLNNEVVSTNQTAFTFAAVNTARSIDVTVTFNGIKSVVKINVAANATSVSMNDVNLAIIRAINDDPTLGALLVAKDGMGNSLLVESLIDGNFAAGDLTVNFTQSSGSTITGTNGGYTWGSSNSALGLSGIAGVDSSVRVTTEGSGTTTEVQNLTITNDIFNSGTATDDYTIVYNGIAYTFARGNDATAFESNLDTALTTGTSTLVQNTDGTFSVVITYDTANTAITNDTVLVKGGVTNVAGSDLGTTSLNTVSMTAGNDVITLNVGSALNANDILVVNDVFGNDTVMNFQTGIDKFDVRSLVSFTGTSNSEINTAGIAGTGTGNALTVANVLSYIDGLSWAANEKGVVFVHNTAAGMDTNTYTAFKVVNDGTGAIVTGEVSILGTVTMGTDGTLTAGAGDLILA